MKYTRLYADSDGETHFEDVEVEFGEGSGRPQLGISAPQPASDSFFLTAYAEFASEFHPSPRKQWFVVLSGIGEFGTSDGETRQWKAGDVILLNDVASKGHTGRAIEPFNIMFVGLEE